MRDLLLPGADLDVPGRNTQLFHLEHSLVITFLYGQHYECNEYCKYYKNVESAGYKFIPAVHRTCYDDGTTHVTGIVSISREEFEAMPPRVDGAWLREHLPDAAASMDRFIDKVKLETNGELVGDLEITRIPLDVYHAWHNTTRRWHESGLDHPLARTPVFLLGDSAIGSPYFQSISLGFESAFYLAGHLANRALPDGGDLRAVREVHVPAVAPGLHAQPDDQAQQGPAPGGRRRRRSPGQAPHLLRAAALEGPVRSDRPLVRAHGVGGLSVALARVRRDVGVDALAPEAHPLSPVGGGQRALPASMNSPFGR